MYSISPAKEATSPTIKTHGGKMPIQLQLLDSALQRGFGRHSAVQRNNKLDTT